MSGSQPLITTSHDQHQDVWSFRIGSEQFMEEAKQQLRLAGPLIAVNILLYCLQVIFLMFVGHLGELQLSGASVATSFAAVTGFSVLLGMGSALETLCGQAYGAKQYQMLGVYTQRGVVVVLALSVGLAVVWYNTSFILVGLGQDHGISAEAGVFNRWMIPSLFAYGILQCLIRFLQTQNIVFPMVVTSAMTSMCSYVGCLCSNSSLELEGLQWRMLPRTGSMWCCWHCMLTSPQPAQSVLLVFQEKLFMT